MEEKYKEVIEIGLAVLAVIEEKLMLKFRLTESDVKSLLDEFLEDVW